jgi:23S rRNA U2552 (ribose-2'-O)-methylase RlmE/FtsJ
MFKTIHLNTVVGDTHFKNNYCNRKLIEELFFYKNKISTTTKWDSYKKISNVYELIYLPSKKNRDNSIASYKPISRSYFKLWEIIIDFNLLNDIKPQTILCLAEGPGGFMEAIINFRERYNIKDNIFGITLKSKHKDVPGWKSSQKLLKKYNIHITYGKDNTGNLYNLDNIKYLNNVLKSKVDLITADGGFDFSTDFNKQEELSYRIIFCEIVSALSHQKINGTFVCKIFDINTLFTLKLLYILTVFYKDVYITKPLTSRPANSEKYIVCKGFKGISESYLTIFYSYILNWETMDINNILSFVNLSDYFVYKIKNFNEYLMQYQISVIKRTLELINKNNVDESIIKNQIEHAVEWCNQYNIEINRFSDYL